MCNKKIKMSADKYIYKSEKESSIEKNIVAHCIFDKVVLEVIQ